ncbi:nucleotidyltransferase domain-containing protein [Pontibacter coccineus]|uniref:nucleotidyltransferase domain-containing protein n=1 Tax=Pontibacter coccineus TaxID=3063328 RepID=UPI003CCDD4B9
MAGGWAIDLFLDRETREHQDVEIAILRREQLSFKHYLRNWSFSYISSLGQLVNWDKGEYLELPVHEVYGMDGAGHQIEILLNEAVDGLWKYRRDLHVTYPLEATIIKSSRGIPILSPEIVLLYKSKDNRPKDSDDLRRVLPDLNKAARAWLANSIRYAHGNIEWVEKIKNFYP